MLRPFKLTRFSAGSHKNQAPVFLFALNFMISGEHLSFREGGNVPHWRPRAAVFGQNGICRSSHSKTAHASATWARIAGRQIIYCRRRIPLTFFCTPDHKSYSPWKSAISEPAACVKHNEDELTGNKKTQILRSCFNHRSQVGFLILKSPANRFNPLNLKSSIFTKNKTIYLQISNNDTHPPAIANSGKAGADCRGGTANHLKYQVVRPAF